MATLRSNRRDFSKTQTSKNNQTNRKNSDTAKESPPTSSSAPATRSAADEPLSPLTPVADTPHPSKEKKEILSQPPKLHSLDSRLQTQSEDSSIPPSQIPSSVAGLNTSKDSSPIERPTTSFIPLPSTRESTGDARTINLDDSDPGARQPIEPSAEDTLQMIRELDASFYRKTPGALWAWDTLEKRMKGYAGYKDLRVEDIVDLGVPIEGARARFRGVVEEFEWLLYGLRTQDPERASSPSWHADPAGVFFKALEGARTLASLSIAWKGLVGRLNAGLFVYAKYLGRAYKAFGAYDGDPPDSPASTTTSFYQEMERFPMEEEKVKFALGSLPSKHWPEGLQIRTAATNVGRARLVDIPDEQLAPVAPKVAHAFPDREPEDEPKEIIHEGYRHYLQGTAPDPGETGRSEKALGKRRESSNPERERVLKEREASERQERKREEAKQEERRRKERLEQAQREQEERRRQEEDELAERRRLEERRAERLRAENVVLDHKLRLERERNHRLEEDEEVEALLAKYQDNPSELQDELFSLLDRHLAREDRIENEAFEEARTARSQHNDEVAAVESQRMTAAIDRCVELERIRKSILEDAKAKRTTDNNREFERKKEKVNFAGYEYVPATRDEGDWDGDDEEGEDDEEAGFPETPAPRGRGKRGGRRTSTTPKRTPFGEAVLPPPLERRGADVSTSRGQRRRSGTINIPGAFGGAPPPDGGGDSSDDEDDGERPPPRGGPGGGRGPPPNPPNPTSGGNDNSRTPRSNAGGNRRGGGGGPPGDPDGGSSSTQPAPAPRNPINLGLPTLLPMLKSSNVPTWDGNRSTAITYFWKINQLARGRGNLAEGLGFWLWQRLTEGSSVESWYMTVSEPVRDWMQSNAGNWTQGLVDGYLGRRWVNQIASEFKQQGFREGYKNRHESPLDYISRRLMYARFLGYSQQGSREELQLIIERVPPHWHHMLSTSTLQDADELKERAIEFETELLASARQDPADLEASVTAILRRQGVYHREGVRPPALRTATKKVAFAAESDPNTSEVEEDLPGLQSIENPSDGEEDEEDPWEEMVASAYSIVQKRAPPPSKKYLFKRRDDVKTKEKRQPPAPCFACGSPYHWNKECPHREEYRNRRSRDGYVVEPGEASREKAYDAAYAMIAAPGFEEAARRETAEPSLERKSDEETESEGESPELNGEVLYINTASVASRIETIEEEYWQAGGSLPVDHPHIMEYVGDEAARNAQPDVDPDHPPAEEREAFSIPDVRPFEDNPIKLKSRIRRPPGQASRGTSVLSVRGRVGSMQEEEIDLHLDSCASLTLLSAQLYDQLRNPPPIRKGAKMRLWQLTSTSDPIRGYVRLPIFIMADDGSTLEAEIEAYVVENMTVPILLGEDFQQAYEVAVDRKVDEGTRVHFGDHDSPVSAANVNRTNDFNKIAKAYQGEVPEKAFAKRAHRKKLKREKKKKERLEREEDFTVRAAVDTTIPAQKAVRVPLQGPFEKGGEWIIEKNLLVTSDSLHLAIPNTIIDHDFPFVPIANLSHAPKRIRKGEVIGKIAIPGDYFDTPSQGDDALRMREHASMMAKICDLQLGDSSQSTPETSRKGETDEQKGKARFAMPDRRTYGAWSAGQEPAKRRFYMPQRDNYAAWAEGEKEEQDEYGPKTAAMPEVEDMTSEEFLKKLDVGSLLERLRIPALKMLDRHRKAFALDGRLGDYEAAARIRLKDGTEPIAVPMFGASPAKKAIIDEQTTSSSTRARSRNISTTSTRSYRP
ncbi:hypothetical protein GGF50DRAFT_127923 [Schizophyllum commune]